MKLDEFEVEYLGPGTVGDRDTVASRDRRIGRLTIQLTRTTGSQQRRWCTGERHPAIYVAEHGRPAPSF